MKDINFSCNSLRDYTEVSSKKIIHTNFVNNDISIEQAITLLEMEPA